MDAAHKWDHQTMKRHGDHNVVYVGSVSWNEYATGAYHTTDFQRRASEWTRSQTSIVTFRVQQWGGTTRGRAIIRATYRKALKFKRLEIALGRGTRGRLRTLSLVHVWGRSTGNPLIHGVDH